ncbi:hypothetical protein H0H81_008693 [Sphagnurus paluster]|uniref:Uncharacterized protein n=1 Tax=Sphagnurus paluster TaxID=117069 RepID=A0A9P7K7A8_9AGAR|nr:hypothetical protein H0H81_008693 [Sphagnurus paluster]
MSHRCELSGHRGYFESPRTAGKRTATMRFVRVMLMLIQFIGALLNLSGYYVIGLPVGAFLTFKWNMGLNGLWLGLTASLVYCSVIGTLLCLKTDWYEEVERVIKRNAEEDKLRKVSDEERDV